jgi:hypothetical protein
MPIAFCDTSDSTPLQAVLSGKIDLNALTSAVLDISNKAPFRHGILLNINAAHLTTTKSEFMSFLEIWFNGIDAQTRTALIYEAPAQRDHMQLFDARMALEGGDFRSFTQKGEALKWLA